MTINPASPASPARYSYFCLIPPSPIHYTIQPPLSVFLCSPHTPCPIHNFHLSREQTLPHRHHNRYTHHHHKHSAPSPIPQGPRNPITATLGTNHPLSPDLTDSWVSYRPVQPQAEIRGGSKKHNTLRFRLDQTLGWEGMGMIYRWELGVYHQADGLERHNYYSGRSLCAACCEVLTYSTPAVAEYPVSPPHPQYSHSPPPPKTPYHPL